MPKRKSRVALVSTAGLVLALGALTGCGESAKQAAAPEELHLVSTLAMSDAAAAKQLGSGFYPVENGQWRWTAGKFSVTLRPPRNSDQSGAVLKVKLTVPEVVISTVKSTSLSATAGGTALDPETYSQPGEYTYTRQVPAAALKGESVKIDFTLSKAIPAGTKGDARELGVVVSSIGLK